MKAEAEQVGGFQPAHSPGRVRLCQKRVETWQRYGFPAGFNTAQESRDTLGSDFWYGGMLNSTGGHINPLALARAMAKAAEGLKATIYESSPVASYEHVGSQWIIRTATGTLAHSKLGCDKSPLLPRGWQNPSFRCLAGRWRRSHWGTICATASCRAVRRCLIPAATCASSAMMRATA